MKSQKKARVNLGKLALFFSLLATLTGATLTPPSAHAAVETQIQLAGVKAQVTKRPLTVSDPEQRAALKTALGDFGYEITFGRLSADQFQRLKTHFRKSEPLSYDPQKSYGLVDFLPAKMQALLNRRLVAKTRVSEDLNQIDLFYKNSGEIFSTINCWGTAWEMVRDPSAASPLITFMSARRKAHKILTSSDFSVQVQAKDATYGDMLLLLANPEGEFTLQHAAVYLGYGFYFERTDSGSEMFFRIVHLDDMKKRLTRAFPGHQVKIELRRFGSPAGKTPLPSPIDVFSVAADQESTYREYKEALPASENQRKITLFVDGRMGGGDEVVVMDIDSIAMKINEATGRGEIDPRDPGAQRLLSSDR